MDKKYEYWLKEVKSDGEILRSVPQNLKDYNMCLEACKNNGSALKYVAEDLKNYDICLEACKNNRVAIYCVPKNLLDLDFYLKVCKENGEFLYDVPKKLRTYKICLEACKNHGMALKYVPEEFRDFKMCSEACKKDNYAIPYVPNELKKDNQFLSFYINNCKINYLFKDNFFENENLLKDCIVYKDPIEFINKILNLEYDGDLFLKFKNKLDSLTLDCLENTNFSLDYRMDVLRKMDIQELENFFKERYQNNDYDIEPLNIKNLEK